MCSDADAFRYPVATIYDFYIISYRQKNCKVFLKKILCESLFEQYSMIFCAKVLRSNTKFLQTYTTISCVFILTKPQDIVIMCKQTENHTRDRRQKRI